MDIKDTTDRTGRPAHVVGGVLVVYDKQEAVDLTVTGVYSARAWAEALGMAGPAPAPVVETSPPNGRGLLDKFPWEK